MNWIKRKILKWVFESKIYSENAKSVQEAISEAKNLAITLDYQVSRIDYAHQRLDMQRDYVSQMSIDTHNLINKKHAHLEEKIENSNAMLYALADYMGCQIVQTNFEGQPLEYEVFSNKDLEALKEEGN